MTGGEERVRALIARRGPVPFSVVCEEALYGADGFYTRGSGAGRARDFLTSPEVGPLFGAVIARAVDGAWEAAGRPDPWIVIEEGAGAGALAAAVLAARPACAPALRYVCVEISPALRAAAAAVLPLEDPAQVLGPHLPSVEGSATEARAGIGPLVSVLAEAPVGPFAGMVVANELLDNLPFDILVCRDGGWREVCVGSSDDGLVEVEVPAAAPLPTVSVPDGARVPRQAAAQEWLRRALARIERGRVIVIDYARTTTEMAGQEWLRTYHQGRRGASPLRHLGQQDITADVALDQLALVRPPNRCESQADWLARNGMGELRDAAAAAWQERAAVGDLDALRARSRVSEAAALADPAGLGGFTVCEWDIAVTSPL